MSLRAAILALAGIGAATFVLLPDPAVPMQPVRVTSMATRPAATRVRPAEVAQVTPGMQAIAPTHAPPPPTPPAGNAVFRFDAQGRLQLDAGTAEHLERLLEDVDGAQRAADGLAAAEAAQARRIAAAYGNYLAARGPLLAGPPMDQTVAAARRRHDELIALRRQLFGADDAARLFGEEEERTRRELDAL